MFEEALQIAEKGREAKGKAERERYTQLNSEFQRIARGDKKAFLSEQCKKGLNDSDNHDGMVTNLEPDILECEVKWALGSITTDKAIRGDRIPAEVFKILKDYAMKVLQSICQKI